MWAAHDTVAAVDFTVYISKRRCDVCKQAFLNPSDLYKLVCKVELDFHLACAEQCLQQFKINNDSGMPDDDDDEHCCDGCRTLFILGDHWHTVTFDARIAIDFCETCFPKVCFEQLNTKPWLIDKRNHQLINIQPVTQREILPEIAADITQKRNERFVALLDSIVVNEHPSHRSILELTLFTDLEDAFIGADTALAMSCAPNQHEVYSLLSDDHGRIAINLIYLTFAEYAAALAQWQSNSTTADREHQHKIVTEKLLSSCVSIEELLPACTTFSSFIRFKNDLAFYYG